MRVPPIVTYGILVACAAALGFTFFLESERGKKRWPRLWRWALLVQVGALGVAYVTLRPGRGVSPQAAMKASATAQRPLLLDMYSNY